MTPVQFMNVFEEFRAPSWGAWRAVLGHLGPQVREFYAIAGRGSGKSRVVALLAACFAVGEHKRAPGERVYCGVFAPDRRQSRITYAYTIGLLRSVPELAALIEREARESVDLRNGTTIEVITASRAAPRGRSYCIAIVEEAAFLPTGDDANPDVELIRALRPALARVPGSLLAVVSSPYAKRGVLWGAMERHRAQVVEVKVPAPVDEDGDVLVIPLEGEAEVVPSERRVKVPAEALRKLGRDPSTLVVTGSTLSFNPTFDGAAIAKAREEDPVSAATEYDAAFRTDVESFVSLEAVRDAVVAGRLEVPPVKGVGYAAFVDPSGGSGADSMTLAVAHREEGGVVVVDAVREARPKFNPDTVVAEFVSLLRRYDVRRVTGDRFGGEWARDPFRKLRVEYEVCGKAKSDLYRDALPLLNSGQLELLDHARLVAQVVGLERRVGRGGRDTVDHGPNGHDDLANVVLGLAAWMTAEDARPVKRAGVVW